MNIFPILLMRKGKIKVTELMHELGLKLRPAPCEVLKILYHPFLLKHGTRPNTPKILNILELMITLIRIKANIL